MEIKIRDKDAVQQSVDMDMLRSENAQLKADLYYVMMLTGVEIPTDKEDCHGLEETD